MKVMQSLKKCKEEGNGVAAGLASNSFKFPHIYRKTSWYELLNIKLKSGNGFYSPSFCNERKKLPEDVKHFLSFSLSFLELVEPINPALTDRMIITKKKK